MEFKCVNLSVFKGVLQGTHPQVQEHLREDVLKQMFLLHKDQKDTSECCAVTSHIIIKIIPTLSLVNIFPDRCAAFMLKAMISMANF